MAVAQIGKDSEALNEENHVRAVLGKYRSHGELPMFLITALLLEGDAIRATG